MNVREHSVFSIQEVEEFDSNWKVVNTYRYAHFNSAMLNLPPEELETFLARAIKSLTDKYEIIKRLQSTSIEVLKDKIDAKTYKLLVDDGISNLYKLRRNIIRTSNGRIFSYVVGIGKVKGDKILDAVAELDPAFGSSLYVERWSENV